MFKNVCICVCLISFVGCGYDSVLEPDDSPPAKREKAKPEVVKMSDDAFRMAAQNGQVDKIHQGIDGGVDLDSADSGDGFTALHFAAHDGRLHVAKLLIEKGATVDSLDRQGHTPLLMAAYNGHTDTVKLLIEKGAQVDARDNQGMTPLIHASSGAYAKTVELLIESGADINAVDAGEGFTPLMTAAALGQAEVVQVLLDNDADKTIEDGDGDTALSHARSSRHAEIVELLE